MDATNHEVNVQTIEEVDEAERLAQLAGNDGIRLKDEHEILFEAACVDYYADRTRGAETWVFKDGTAITATGGTWDVRAPGCKLFCWEGQGCECEQED